MPLRGSNLWVRVGIRAVLLWLLSWYGVGMVSEFYTWHNYLKYYYPFAQIGAGMSKAEVHKLVGEWRRDHHSEQRAHNMSQGDVEVYDMYLQYEGGDCIRIYYEDSLVATKEALSEGKNVLTGRDMLRRERVFRGNIAWLTIGLAIGSLGIVFLPLCWKRRKVATSEREKGIKTLFALLCTLLALVGSAIVFTISLLAGFWSAMLMLLSS